MKTYSSLEPLPHGRRVREIAALVLARPLAKRGPVMEQIAAILRSHGAPPNIHTFVTSPETEALPYGRREAILGEIIKALGADHE